MIVEIISVGTEILLGNIVNTNAAYLAENVLPWDYPVIIRPLWEIMKSGLRRP